MIRVQSAPFDPSAEAAAMEAAGAGAVVTFTGLVRDESAGAAVTGLHLEHYPGVTEREIARIAEAARARFDVLDMRIVHGYGYLAPGVAIVFVGVAAAHRRAAFEAADYLMDYLKTEAPFWKRETGPGGARWIEPRAEDHADRARWREGGA